MKKNDAEFLHKAQQWQDTWNMVRPHYGIDMKGMTPLKKTEIHKGNCFLKT